MRTGVVAFTHGGKDATPYPVDRQTYDQTITILQKVARKAKIRLNFRKYMGPDHTLGMDQP